MRSCASAGEPDGAVMSTSAVTNEQIYMSIGGASSFQVPAPEMHQWSAFADQHINDAPDDNRNAVALQALLQHAIHGSKCIRQHRGSGRKRRPGCGLEPRSAFDRGLAGEEISDRARLLREKVNGKVTCRNHDGQCRRALV